MLIQKALKEISAQQSHRKFMDTIYTPIVSFNVNQIGDPQYSPSCFGEVIEYEASIKVSTFFRANSAQVESFTRDAQRRITHECYGDLICNCEAALSAVHSGDKEAASYLLQEILTQIKGQ